MIVDSLMLLGENRFGPSIDVGQALSLADRLGLDTIVAAPARPLDYHLEPANTRLAREVQDTGGRIVPLGRVDPLNGERAVAEAQRCVRDLGCVGLFLHPAEEAYRVTATTGVLEVAEETRVPVVIATGYQGLSEPLQVAELADRFPDLPIVMTHCGQINISGLSLVDAWLALTRHPTLHVLTNGEYRQDFIERLATELDARRVLFGSFAPTFDPAFERQRIKSARLQPDARRAIEGDTAVRLFHLDR